jgi:hypothetical protein
LLEISSFLIHFELGFFLLLVILVLVFDSEELLESSILSIKEEVEYICVVYQTVSNFGNPCHKHLEKLLKDLVSRGLVNGIL